MRHSPVLCFALLIMVGCSQFQQNERDNSYIGWYCVDNAKTEIKDCEKRLMKNGQPISEEVFGRLGEGRDQALVRQEKAWSASLPSLDNTPITQTKTVEDTNGLAVENHGPAPRPVKAFKVWADEGLGVAAPSANPIKQPAPDVSQQAVKPLLRDGYTIQLAAFKKDQQCNEYIQRFVGGTAPLSIRHIFSNSQPFCVVTHGSYPSLEEATKASSILLANNSKADTWVRSWASIKQAETDN